MWGDSQVSHNHSVSGELSRICTYMLHIYIYTHIDYNSLSSPRSHFGASEGGFIFINIHRDTSFVNCLCMHGLHLYHGFLPWVSTIVCVYDIYILGCSPSQ